ncbi:MAG: mannonate dehydratase [Spirosomataceae bacterium]
MNNLPFLQKTFRWFGGDFGVSLAEIRELGVTGIVTACHKIPIGEVWSSEAISEIKTDIERAGMKWAVVESVNIHNVIKYAKTDRDFYIENYIKTLQNLAKNGVYQVCYNFMPLIDWTRTDLNHELPSGVVGLKYDPVAAAVFDLFILKRVGADEVYTSELLEKAEAFYKVATPEQLQQLEATILAGMPGSKERISTDFFRDALTKVSEFNKADLQDNLAYFLRAVIPEAEKIGVQLAIHPDDPPFSVFGIPRIASTYEDLKFIFESYLSLSNGLTFCSGSLGATVENDLPKIIQDFGDKIHFIHLRSVQRESDGSFYEAAHLQGSINMIEVMKALINEQRTRFANGRSDVSIPLRPDHGHLFLADRYKSDLFYPGYSFVGRAIGLAELTGLEMGVRSTF